MTITHATWPHIIIMTLKLPGKWKRQLFVDLKSHQTFPYL